LHALRRPLRHPVGTASEPRGACGNTLPIENFVAVSDENKADIAVDAHALDEMSEPKCTRGGHAWSMRAHDLEQGQLTSE